MSALYQVEQDEYISNSQALNDAWNNLKLQLELEAAADATFPSSYKTLAVGDSICKAVRDDNLGYVGRLGVNDYFNGGVGGTFLSNYHERLGKATQSIPEHMKTLLEDPEGQMGKPEGWTPNLIIMEGGINDTHYQYANKEVTISLGDVPTKPITTDEELEAVEDKTTISFGLQKMFYYADKLAPNAIKVFVMHHRAVWYWNTHGPAYSTMWSGGMGFGQKGFRNLALKTAQVYGVYVADLWTTELNAEKSEFLSMWLYDSDAAGFDVPKTEEGVINADGVHPLPRGYAQYYVREIRKAVARARLGGCLHRGSFV